MVRITEELLRKRSEHNEGCLSTLEEITLHQFDIEKIELLGEFCRNLKILFLQHNLIEKIENLEHLKRLEYLSMAINSVRRIENLSKNEELKKLDLTVNYVDDLLSVQSLKDNYNLEEIHLLGNPCFNYKGYRSFVIHSLPQLKNLDGDIITKFERIKASQEYDEIRKNLVENQGKWIDENNRNMVENEKNPKYDENGERLYGNDPISRKLAAKETQRKDKNVVDGSKIGGLDKVGKEGRRRLTPSEEIEKYGKVMQKNEGKWKFKFFDEKDKYILDIPVGKFCLTSQIEVDVQPKYVIVDVRKKRLCLRFEHEVNPDKAEAQRSNATGNLKIAVPKENREIKI